MRFIVDECTGMAVAEHLGGGGHDVVAQTLWPVSIGERLGTGPRSPFSFPLAR